MTRRRSGESAAEYVSRLEDELDAAEREIESAPAEEHDHCEDQRQELEIDSARHEELRGQLENLSTHIMSPSAPRSRQQMRRLIDGLLRGEDWRHGTWRR